MMQVVSRVQIIQPGSKEWAKALSDWQRASRFGLDIETFGDAPGDGLNPFQGSIRLIQIGLEDGRVLVVDLGGRGHRRAIPGDFLAVLEESLSNLQVEKIGHNLKFDCLWLMAQFGLKTRTVRDTMLASEIYWGGLRVRHSLKELCLRLQVGDPEGIDKTQQASDWGIHALSQEQLEYAALDTQYAIQCWDKMTVLLNQDELYNNAIAEMVALPAFVEMEFYGMPVDRALLESHLAAYLSAQSDVIKVFHQELTGDLIQENSDQLALFEVPIAQVNPDSPQQTVTAINRKYGLSLTSSAQEALAPYWDKPAIRALSLYRTLGQSIDYLKGCLEAERDGAVRGSYDQLAPKSFGRSACGDDKESTRRTVNLQNPPGRLPSDLVRYNLPLVRTAFKPPAGYSLLVADLSQAHARIACDASKDETLTDAYLNGSDCHCVTASQLAKLNGLGSDWTPTNIAKWRKDKSHPNHAEAVRLRDVSKNVLYGSLNGQGAKTLLATAETQGVSMKLDEARQAIAAFRQTYKGLYRFQLDLVNIVNEATRTFDWMSQEKVPHGFAELRGGSGRRIYFPKFPSDFRPDEPPTVKLSDVCAFFWTSCEADVIKLAAGAFQNACDHHPDWDATIRNCCHDELDVCCKTEYAAEVAKSLQLWMRASMRLFITSIPVDEDSNPEALIVSSWAEK